MKILQISPTDNVIGGATGLAMDLKSCLENNNIQSPMFVGKKFSDLIDIKEIPKNIFNKAVSFLLASDLDYFQSDIILSSKDFYEANLVHCHNLHGWYFKLETLRKIAQLKPVVWTLHDMWAITPHCSHSFSDKQKDGFYLCSNKNIYPGILWHNERYLMKKKRFIYENNKFNIVVPSLWLKEKVEKSVLKDQKITLINNGVDVDIFKKYNTKDVRREFNLPFEKKIVLVMSFAGKDNPFKGWSYVEKIIERFINNKDVTFVCIGDGLDSERVKYLPLTRDRNVMSKYYSLANVLLYTSLAENFPLVILEAMSCGLPIVSFDVGGIGEVLIDRVNGYLADYKSLSDLENGLMFILNMPLMRLDKMVNNSEEVIREKYTLQIMTQKYIDLYKSCLN
ncbi:MAG: hypothetical protein COY69_00830 [Candidatus Magasanikbacteria bacterium CG_4_10_14_0_8_um_filter_32_14]|uniref:Glycosyltransferase subfamily 4-like N-terminal domain-containing protein n=1 Tax=Candidatus Magasanikbacteria bacterium CG_4_10_14_0_8_um_filter_32_14 TaxID=1974640 RepID=A0A2M7RA07_9BACT|nr:MAG: hypothetical protein COY69_00830 [Candidatus Magasanikbacteria bacterium CG_4_10_14_0_8_um_filter_32_14]